MSKGLNIAREAPIFHLDRILQTVEGNPFPELFKQNFDNVQVLCWQCHYRTHHEADSSARSTRNNQNQQNADVLFQQCETNSPLYGFNAQRTPRNRDFPPPGEGKSLHESMR